jgi:hypothetical protein
MTPSMHGPYTQTIEGLMLLDNDDAIYAQTLHTDH